jgi:hypothetical protein
LHGLVELSAKLTSATTPLAMFLLPKRIVACRLAAAAAPHVSGLLHGRTDLAFSQR